MHFVPIRRGSSADKNCDRQSSLGDRVAKLGSNEAETLRIKDALGRPVMRVVRDREGQAILEPGDLITYASIEIAKQNDALGYLLDSAYRHKQAESHAR